MPKPTDKPPSVGPLGCFLLIVAVVVWALAMVLFFNKPRFGGF